MFNNLMSRITSVFQPAMPPEYLEGIRQAQLELIIDEAVSTALAEICSAPAPAFKPLVAVFTPPGKVTLDDGLGANEVFNEHHYELEHSGHSLDWNPQWGRSGRGYKGLLKSSPLPGTWCTIDPDGGSKVIFHADGKGVLCILYQEDNKVTWSAPEEVKVIFTSLELTEKEVSAFIADTYLAV
jgi:hypothetical protein